MDLQDSPPSGTLLPPFIMTAAVRILSPNKTREIKPLVPKAVPHVDSIHKPGVRVIPAEGKERKKTSASLLVSEDGDADLNTHKNRLIYKSVSPKIKRKLKKLKRVATSHTRRRYPLKRLQKNQQHSLKDRSDGNVKPYWNIHKHASPKRERLYGKSRVKRPKNRGLKLVQKGEVNGNRKSNPKHSRHQLKHDETKGNKLFKQADRKKFMRLPKKRIKYKYGLRRGLPAVTVGDFGADEKPPIMWYQNEFAETSADLHAASTPQGGGITTEVPKVTRKDVAQFGPADAVTDKLRNALLYEYIRDQVKEA